MQRSAYLVSASLRRACNAFASASAFSERSLSRLLASSSFPPLSLHSLTRLDASEVEALAPELRLGFRV